MADIVKDYSLFGIKVESSEGTFNEPANSDYIEVLADGVKITKTREVKARDLLDGDQIAQDFRLSGRNVEVEVPVELKSGDGVGVAPQWQPLLESFGMSSRGLSAEVTSETDHTTTEINIADADIAKFKKNDIVMVKAAGAFHYSPIASVDAVSEQKKITLAIAMASAPANGVKLEKCQLLVMDKTVNKTLSARRVMEGNKVTEKCTGLRTNTVTLQNFKASEYASLLFKLVGLSFEDKLESGMSIDPDYDESEPPIIVEACLYKNGAKLTIDEFTLQMERTVAFKTSTCAADGKVGSRHTGKVKITGTLNPYKNQDSIDFKLDESEFSLFVRCYNPTGTPGENKEAIAFFLPKVKATAIEVADLEGLMVDQVTYQMVADEGDDAIVIGLF